MGKRSVVVVALLACALAGQPRHAVAQAVGGDVEIERFDKDKFWDYALCGVSVAFAAGTQGWFVAAIACGRAFSYHWNE